MDDVSEADFTKDGAERLWSKGIYENDYTQSILTIQQQFNEQLGG